MKVVGGTDWLSQAIARGTLIAVTDGSSYIQEHYPEICSAAFILECKHSGGRVTRAFPEALLEANAFQGELLGLMAVHLLLLAVNTVSPGLTGLVLSTQTAWGPCPGLQSFLPTKSQHVAGTLTS